MAEQPRIGIWRAVSTEDQAEKESLDYQDRLNKEHAARWNGVIVADMEVPGISRSIVLWEDACRAIPAYAQLDDLIKRKAIDMLICMDVTRLGRDRALIVTTAALCERAGIRIYETSSPPPSIEGPHSTSDSRLLMMLKGHISEEEVRKFNERSLFGRQAQVRKGKHTGQRPIGYKRAYNSDGQSITVIDEERAPLVKLFYELYLDHGRTLRSIAKEFNERGYRRPVSELAWNQSAVARFLRNRWAYAGYSTWGEYSANPEKSFRAKAEWPALISEETVHQVEDEMKRRSRAPRAASTPKLFSFVCRCGYCDCNITCKHMENKRSKYNCYICCNECKGSFVREKLLKDAVRETILVLQNEIEFDRMVGDKEDSNSLPAQIEFSKKQLSDIQKERDKLTHAYMRDTISIEEYDNLMAELKERYGQIARTIMELEKQQAKTPTADQREARLAQIRDSGLAMLDHPDIKTANAWLRRHFIIYVKANKVIEVMLF